MENRRVDDGRIDKLLNMAGMVVERLARLEVHVENNRKTLNRLVDKVEGNGTQGILHDIKDLAKDVTGLREYAEQFKPNPQLLMETRKARWAFFGALTVAVIGGVAGIVSAILGGP